MVRQAYIHRLVLGRSSFDLPGQSDGNATQSLTNEAIVTHDQPSDFVSSNRYVQRYNSRGYPDNRASRHLSRRSRHAQNDILTTIGVCVSVDEQESIAAESRAPKTPVEREQASVVIEEHWYGSLLGSVTEVAGEAFTLWIKFVRRRVQVFTLYANQSINTVVQSEWLYGSRFSFLAAGLIPDICFHGIKGFVEGIWEALEEYIGPGTLRLAFKYLPFDPIKIVFVSSWLSKIGARSVRILFEVLVDVYLMLQKLHLVESWPPISGRALSAVISLRPPLIGGASNSAFAFAHALLSSPYALCFIYNFAEETLREKLFTYMQTILIRPDNPDSSSFRLELDDERVDPSEASVLRLPTHQRTISEQLAADLRSFQQTMRSFMLRVSGASMPWPSSHTGQEAPGTIDSQRTLRREQTARSQPPDTAPSTMVSFAPNDQTFIRPGTPEAAEGDSTPHREPPSPDPNMTPPQSPGGSSSSHMSEVDPSAVQVRTRSGSTSTLHMDLEVQLPVNSQGVQERRQNSFTTSDQITPPPKKLLEASSGHYRVTQLTVHSSTTLSVQLALVLSSAILMPLESMYLRSIARSFLDSQGVSPTHVNRLIYPPFRPGLRNFDWKGTSMYMGQMLMCIGIETTVRLYFWRICGSVSLWWGRSKFGWGHL